MIKTVLKRCISGIPSFICPLIRPRYLQRSRRDLIPIEVFSNANDTDEHPQFEDMVIMDQKKVAVNEPMAKCKDNRKLAEEFLQEKVVSSHFDVACTIKPLCVYLH